MSRGVRFDPDHDIEAIAGDEPTRCRHNDS
jgi:hypothetical protein